MTKNDVFHRIGRGDIEPGGMDPGEGQSLQLGRLTQPLVSVQSICLESRLCLRITKCGRHCIVVFSQFTLGFSWWMLSSSSQLRHLCMQMLIAFKQGATKGHSANTSLGSIK